ncbi:Rubredoxin (chromatophore) [Paulinella micropora]|uniref:Rubredoxin n=1 Tax=Paulinella micropora TaxID=1928728 RepID=A0A1L5YC36_9EUKA|nr:rubredoxin [Paulinella micropora]AQX45038.1 rubredoxin [Paulinella micropora]BBL86251.1 Rubredoxin [Paulinella micropora]
MRDELEPQPAKAMPVNQFDQGEELLSNDTLTLKSIKPESVSLDEIRTHRFECRGCGYVYDPAEGIKKLSIAAGTPFIELDQASFRCPVCRSKIGAFKDIGDRNKPSGFEENLNYGLGVNRLTPGQKNVLIFGGFALAFAFFLSLYSLR